ncbi:MAG: restriction endonuclease subunit S [Fluviicola sp.]|nr:restriction endonuclease subunit S [Fluviicola sp.]
MMVRIDEVKLGEIATFRNGLNFSKETRGKGCLLIGIPDFKNRSTPIYESLGEINPEGVAKADDYLKIGDVIFVRSNGNKDLVGRSLYIDKDVRALYSGFCIRARLKSKAINPLFFSYFTKTSYFKSMISSSGGTSIQNLNQTILGNVKIPVFSESLQYRITKILSDLDAKIELNNKVNTELKSMTKLIYEYWFVQFDFPDQNGKPYKSSGGKMIYNEELKREIPEDWAVKNLGDYASIKKGTLITAKTSDLTGKIKVVSAGIDFSYFNSEANYEANTITVSASGASAGFINFWREPIFACDCTTIRGSSLPDTLQLLGFLVMRQEHIYKQARGSAQPHVYPKDIEALKIATPPKSIISEFGKLVVSGNEKISINLNENQKLAELKDWILPMLMNGQVKVN